MAPNNDVCLVDDPKADPKAGELPAAAPKPKAPPLDGGGEENDVAITDSFTEAPDEEVGE